MCTDAVDVVDREAGREYGFNSYKEKPAHASQLHLQPSKDDLADLSTNNLDAENIIFLCLVVKLQLLNSAIKVYSKGYPKWRDPISVQNISKYSK